jgi:hypothetical protein
MKQNTHPSILAIHVLHTLQLLQDLLASNELSASCRNTEAFAYPAAITAVRRPGDPGTSAPVLHIRSQGPMSRQTRDMNR